ncbi:MAG: hypothetical protein Q8R28_13380 [Dehalococcoidia bacterium]|nr:hypothetical protein [Dehalococcoidia bacterium]
MPLPLALSPLVAVLVAVGLFFMIRWWLGKTGAAFFFTLSIMVNLSVLAPVALGIMAVQEVQAFQNDFATSQKLVILEQGPNILLAVSFTDVKNLDASLSSFKPLSKEQVQAISATTGDARYKALAKTFYKVFVVKQAFLEKLVSDTKSAQSVQTSQSPQGQPSPQENAAIQNLLVSAASAFQAGDMNKLASVAVDLQKAYRDRGMNDAADLARQIEQAARAKDLSSLATLGPRLAQLAIAGAGGVVSSTTAGPSGGATPGMPVSGDIMLKAIASDDPVKVVLPYLSQQTIQQLGGGDPARLKLMLVAYLLGIRFQNSFDPIFLLSEYRNSDLQIFPESTLSALVRLLPLDQLIQQLNTKPKS